MFAATKAHARKRRRKLRHNEGLPRPALLVTAVTDRAPGLGTRLKGAVKVEKIAGRATVAHPGPELDTLDGSHAGRGSTSSLLRADAGAGGADIGARRAPLGTLLRILRSHDSAGGFPGAPPGTRGRRLCALGPGSNRGGNAGCCFSLPL